MNLPSHQIEYIPYYYDTTTRQFVYQGHSEGPIGVPVFSHNAVVAVAVPAYPPPAIAESHHRALRAHQELLEQIGRLQESNCDLIRECNAHGERLSAKDKEIQALQQEKAELECRINRLQSDNVELQEKAIKDSTKMLAVQLQEEKMRESLVLMQNVNKNLLGRNAALEHHIKSLPQPSTTPSSTTEPASN